MGLDHWLYKKTYVSNWDGKGDTPEERERTSERAQLKITGLKSRVNPKKVTYIVEDVATWRKANAIHKWFVDYVQNGEDDCKSYYVDKSDLESLYGSIMDVLSSTKLVDGKVYAGTSYKDGKATEEFVDGKVLEDTSVAEEKLPTQSGFFFGGTGYDEYYWQDLEYTRDVLRECLNDNSFADYEYGSSW